MGRESAWCSGAWCGVSGAGAGAGLGGEAGPAAPHIAHFCAFGQFSYVHVEQGHLVFDEALACPCGDDSLSGFNLSVTASAPQVSCVGKALAPSWSLNISSPSSGFGVRHIVHFLESGKFSYVHISQIHLLFSAGDDRSVICPMCGCDTVV